MRVRRAVKKEAQRRRKRHVRAEQKTEQKGSHKLGWYQNLRYSWHGLRTPRELLGLGRQVGLKFFEAFGVL